VDLIDGQNHTIRRYIKARGSGFISYGKVSLSLSWKVFGKKKNNFCLRTRSINEILFGVVGAAFAGLISSVMLCGVVQSSQIISGVLFSIIARFAADLE
jgi:hypothetical protein